MENMDYDEPFVVLEGRNPGWFWIDNEIVDDHGAVLGSGGLLVYMVLCRHRHNRTKRCYPSLSRICKLTGLSKPTVIKHIRVLESEKLILVERKPNKPNFYTLLDVTKGSKNSLPPPSKVVKSTTQVVKPVYRGGKNKDHEQDLYNKTKEQDSKKESSLNWNKLSKLRDPAYRKRYLAKQHS